MVYWETFDPEAFDYEFDEDELAAHGVDVDEALEVIWNGFDARRNKRHHVGYQLVGRTDGGRRLKLIAYEKGERRHSYHHGLGRMTLRKKDVPEIERSLIADAQNPDAWDDPVSVGPSAAPRPRWYGRARHLDLAAKFHVLSVLHRLGAEAAMTYAQPDNVDIAAVRQSGEAFTIDVKTLRGTTLWEVEPFRARKNHFVVFVCFERELTNPQEAPDVYMWASDRLKAFISEANVPALSLEVVASQLDPQSAWSEFAAEPHGPAN